MAIKPKAVLDTLNQRHGGVLRFEGTDCAAKLLRSMRMRDGLVGELRERLRAMAETNQIVIECEGNRFDLIATPEALEATDDTKDGTEDMIAPAGQRKTTYARDGEGRELPSHLGPQHVGPLTVTRPAGKTDEAVDSAAELVYDELVKNDKSRYGRDELLAIVLGYLLPLYDDKEEVASVMAKQVLTHLQCSQRASLVPVPGRRGEFVIEIAMPEPVEAEGEEVTAEAVQELDPVELLARLVPELEVAQQRIVELKELNENTVSIEVVAELTERAEGLQTENEGFRRKLEAAAVEKEKILAGQRERLAKVRSAHDAALAAVRDENARALAAVRKELEAVRSENASLKEAAAHKALPADLQRRVDKILGK